MVSEQSMGTRRDSYNFVRPFANTLIISHDLIIMNRRRIPRNFASPERVSEQLATLSIDAL